MASFNKVILMGNLTRDPELKFLPSGTPVAEFGLAMNRKWTDTQTNQPREAVTFVDCKSMGRQAEVLNQYCKKGSPLFIEGRLDYRQWDAQDGTKRSKLEVFVENFQFVGAPREQGAGGADGAPAPGRGAPRPAGRSMSQGRAAESAGDMEAPAGFSAPTPDDDVPF